MSENKKLTTDEVWDVVNFANSLYGELKGGRSINYKISKNDSIFHNKTLYNICDENLKDINGNVVKPSMSELETAIKDYKTNYKSLQAYSEFMNVFDTIYSSITNYEAGLLSYDINKYCINIKDDKERQSEEYLEDLKRVNKFLSNYNTKYYFDQITKMCLSRDTAFTYSNFDNIGVDMENSIGTKFLPQEDCKIIGDFTSKNTRTRNVLFKVDVSNIRFSLHRYYENFLKNMKNKESEEEEIVINYVKANPSDGLWCFKYNTNDLNICPPHANLLRHCINDEMVEKLQMDKDIISANAIITGEFKTKKDTSDTDAKNMFLLDPVQVGEIMHLFSQAVNNNIKQLALPLEETKLFQFTDNNSAMYRNQLVSTAGQGVSANSLVYTDDKMSQEEIRMATNNDFIRVSKRMYPQFEDFLNFYVNKKTRKYKFRFTLSGSTLQHLRKQDIDNFKMVSDMGIQVPIQKWGTLLGVEPQAFEEMVRESVHGDMKEQLFLLMNTNTSNDGTEIGAPVKENGDLAEGGEISREYE